MARAMVAFLATLIGHVRGGLSYVLLGGMLLVSGISGSKAADMAAVAPVLFPEMKRRGLDEGEMVSLLAASGAMAEAGPRRVALRRAWPGRRRLRRHYDGPRGSARSPLRGRVAAAAAPSCGRAAGPRAGADTLAADRGRCPGLPRLYRPLEHALSARSPSSHCSG